MTSPHDQFNLRAAPMRIGRLRLRVRDLDAMSRFYRDIIGLSLLRHEGGAAVLGAGSRPLIELSGDPGLRARDPRDAGLYHVAFLLPERADLARWLAFASAQGVGLQGASDHGVSEALYLADPEGNGIEIYADHPPSQWRGADGSIHMTTERLDVPGLLAATGGERWSGFPAGGCIGHVHLQVGDEVQAERFYAGVLGFDPTTRMRGARFFGSGGYHHHVATNVWNSRGAGPRPDGSAGLAAVEIIVADASRHDAILARAADSGLEVTRNGESAELRDPWGTGIELVASV